MTSSIYGMGTGRCGTKTLARLLDGCKNVACEHEPRPILPWEHDYDKYRKHLGRDKWAVALYYGRYANDILKDTDSKIVVLRRQKEDTIKSFLDVTPHRNHWDKHIAEEWDEAFPSYELPKAKGIEKYYDEYYEMMLRLHGAYPDRVMMFPTEELSDKSWQKRLFNFCEIPEQDRIYDDIVTNKREEHVGYSM